MKSIVLHGMEMLHRIRAMQLQDLLITIGVKARNLTANHFVIMFPAGSVDL